MKRLALTVLATLVTLTPPLSAHAQLTAERSVEPVIVKGAKLAGWSGPSAVDRLHAVSVGALTGARDAHNGIVIAPPAARRRR